MRGWPHVCEAEDGWRGERRGESTLCVVQYNLALWFLSRGHVANFPHRRYSFPWLHLSLNPLLHSNFFWLSPTLVFSSRGDTGERLPLCLNCKDVTFWSAYRKIKCSLCAACLSVMCCKQQKKKNLWRCWQEVSFKQQTTHLFEYVNQIKSM